MRNVIFNIVIYVLVPVVLIWGVMYYSWKGYNSYRINHYGQDAVAVITRKWDGTLYYDVELRGNIIVVRLLLERKFSERSLSESVSMREYWRIR